MRYISIFLILSTALLLLRCQPSPAPVAPSFADIEALINSKHYTAAAHRIDSLQPLASSQAAQMELHLLRYILCCKQGQCSTASPNIILAYNYYDSLAAQPYKQYLATYYMAYYYSRQTKHYDMASGLFAQAAVRAQRLQQPVFAAKSYYQMGYIFSAQQQYDSALHYYQQAVQLFANTDHLNALKLHKHIGNVYMYKKNFEAALQSYGKGLSLAYSLQVHQSAAAFLQNIALVYFYQKDYPQSLYYSKRALKQSKRLPDKAKLHINIADIYLKLRLVDSAQQHLQFVAHRLTKLPVAVQGRYYQLQGSLYLQQGQSQRAMALVAEYQHSVDTMYRQQYNYLQLEKKKLQASGSVPPPAPPLQPPLRLWRWWPAAVALLLLLCALGWRRYRKLHRQLQKQQNDYEEQLQSLRQSHAKDDLFQAKQTFLRKLRHASLMRQYHGLKTIENYAHQCAPKNSIDAEEVLTYTKKAFRYKDNAECIEDAKALLLSMNCPFVERLGHGNTILVACLQIEMQKDHLFAILNIHSGHVFSSRKHKLKKDLEEAGYRDVDEWLELKLPPENV